MKVEDRTIEQIFIYDTTLRDGAQAEGIHFSVGDKIRIARKLDEFGISYIEGGWPSSNPKDSQFFWEAQKIPWRTAKVVAFGSTCRPEVEEPAKDAQLAALLEAATPAVAIFGKSSLSHVREVLRTTPERNLQMIASSIAYLKSHQREVIYDAEHFFDGYKEEPAYALETLRVAAEAGADWIVLCDTNGGSLPTEVGRVTREVAKVIRVPLGIHTHNDGELAVANALAAVEAGATQIQGTINGYGERTGNCNLISVIANLQLKMGKKVIDPERLATLRELSLFVDEVANQRPNPRAPFVGSCAFAHKGGTHVNALRKLLRSYEHINPEAVGNRRRILVGELSGRANIAWKAKELGLEMEDRSPKTKRILEEIKRLEARGYEFEAAEASLELLMRRVLGNYQPFFRLLEYHVSIRSLPVRAYEVCEATVKIEVQGKRRYTVAEGDGPVHALDNALRAALQEAYPQIERIRLTDYKVRIVDPSRGTEASIRVLVESSDGTARWTTVAASTNIVEASWLALVDSIEFYLLRSGGSREMDPEKARD
ncbi:citramalate synthase [Candidatus Methylacidithermus pantelleriae]|uniref:Citramalate synthase n=1 Tax=Candidatus Methylacidithermus pantelleriae TaxID=2744239 RepID=A0A8J2FX56_9BACT|nr:citramalate synthase [Candidatus Methylacidithermus pantelleriae]CAF0703342.1 (R)-citramalate synthase [Candidatus Methylacidithermus pantelleriae]